MEILGIGIIDINTDRRPWLAFQKKTMTTRSIDSQGDISGAQLSRYQEGPIYGDRYVFKKDHFGLGFLILKFTAPDGASNTELENTFHNVAREIISKGDLQDPTLTCPWSHLIVDADKFE